MVTVQKMQEILVQDQGEQVSLAPSNCVIHETKYMVYVSGLPEDGTKVWRRFGICLLQLRGQADGRTGRVDGRMGGG